jgi:CheY-like chemotaxis protein
MAAMLADNDVSLPAEVLIVDDNPMDRLLAGSLTEKLTGMRVAYAENGAVALQQIAREKPRVVLTDLQMDEMNGLELVEAMRTDYPDVPVILMTAVGSEQVALAALSAGAVSYIPKRELDEELNRILPKVLSAARKAERRQRLYGSARYLELHLELDNDPALVPELVLKMQEYAVHIGVVNDHYNMRLGVALEESLLNGMYHGNLEVSSELRQDGGQAFEKLAAVRRRYPPYANRKLHFRAHMDPREAIFVIRDEGPGFNPADLPDPTDPENILRSSGRGLLLIRTFMDEVRHNASGNEITMIKRKRGVLKL